FSLCLFYFSSRRRHTRFSRDWSSDVCSSDLLVDILLALPSFLLALAIVSTLGPSLTNVMIAVGIAYIPAFARVMRSAVLAVRQLDYVTAALAAGASDLRIMRSEERRVGEEWRSANRRGGW